MQKAWIFSISLLAVLVLLIGIGTIACGGNGDENGAPPPGNAEEMAPPEDEEEVTTPAASEPEIPAHYTTYTDEVGLFSISYPSDWETTLFLIEDLEEFVEDLATSIEEDIPVERTSFIFIAGLPTEMGYAPVANIVVESLPGVIWTHDSVVEAEIQGIKAIIQDYHEFSRVKTIVDEREATILHWEGTYPELGQVDNSQMIILVGKTVWIVTCTPPSGEFSDWEEDFNTIVRSLRILK